MDRTDLLLQDEIPVIILDNFYDDSELTLIWEELEFLTYSHKLLPPDQTGSALNQEDHETPLKSNSGIFLDTVWANQRQMSNILNVNRKIFNDDMKVFKDSPSWFFREFRCLLDHTLISYYEQGDYYKPHKDNSYVTALSWFCREPKRFSGGDLRLHSEHDMGEVEYANNRTVIFPSCISHEVTPVVMDKKYYNKRLGRYCMTQFLDLPING